MKISIITPTFNAANTIRKNIESVVNQTYENVEQIIIDNLSADDTIKQVKSIYKQSLSNKSIRIISERDKGIADAFNKGLKMSDGDIVGILNADDYYNDNNVLEKVINGFKGTDRIFVHGNIYFNDPVFGSNFRKPLLCNVTKAMPFNHPTMFFKKELFETYGYYNPDFKLAMDFEFICRLSNQIENFSNKGCYLSGKPIVQMSSGGDSWVNEISTIKETKKALLINDLWNLEASLNYYSRIIRTRLKLLFSFIGIRYIVKLWRKIKWGY